MRRHSKYQAWLSTQKPPNLSLTSDISLTVGYHKAWICTKVLWANSTFIVIEKNPMYISNEIMLLRACNNSAAVMPLGFQIQVASSNAVGIICLVGIGLTETPNSGWAKAHPAHPAHPLKVVFPYLIIL